MTMIGTQGYAAPEQYSGKAEVRSDLYALAALMHQALSGRDPALHPPFSFPPISALRPGLNGVLAKCVDHALWYDPSGRPASAAEMRELLLQIPRSTVSNKLIAFAQSRQVTESASADAPTAPVVLDFSDCGTELPDDGPESANRGTSKTFQSVTGKRPIPPSIPQPPKPVPMSEERWISWLVVGGVTIAAGFVVLSLPAGTPHHSGPENAKSSTESASAGASPSSTDPTELNGKEKVEIERKLLDSVRPLPSSDYAGNLKIYEQLLALRPDNARYRQKVDTYRQMNQTGGSTYAAPHMGTDDLRKYVGTYPFEKFLRLPQIKVPLEGVLGGHLEELKSRFDVVVPIEMVARDLFVSGCRAHDCADNNACFSINVDTGEVVAATLKNGEDIDIYSRTATNYDELPPAIKRWVMGLKGADFICVPQAHCNLD
jgi:hypothetical protein